MSEQVKDVFLSHTSKDKDNYVRPFAQELKRHGITYWLDEAEIRWGDKITKKINDGMRRSKYVIVFLSDNFLGRNWPEAELESALNKETTHGRTVVLPILIGNPEAIIEHYPLLRDKLYLEWNSDLPTIVEHLKSLLAVADQGGFDLKPAEAPTDGTLVRGNKWDATSKEAVVGQKKSGNSSASLSRQIAGDQSLEISPISEQALPLTKTITSLLFSRRLWLVAGLALVLLISLIVAARLAFPHWFASVVKPDIQKTQSPKNLNSSKVATPTDLNLKQTLNGHKGIVWSVAFSPKGGLAASASEDKTILLWDTQTLTRKFSPLIGHTGEVYSIAFAPEGKILASGSSDKTIKLWDAQIGQLIETLPGEHTKPVLRLAFSPDGSLLASCSGDPQKGGEEIRLWDVHNGWKSKILKGDISAVFAITFSPDSRTLVSAGFDKKVRLWNLRSDKQSQVLNVDRQLTTLAFSSDGKYMACGSNDGTIWLYQPRMQKWEGQPELLKGQEGFITSIAFSPDNKTLVSASTDKTIRLWDVEAQTSKRLSASKDVFRAPQRCVAFSLDGQTLMTGGEDKMVRIWQ